jgi:hypothetical protein
MNVSTLKARFEQLFADAETWRAHWREVRDYLLPTAGAYLTARSVINPVERGGKVRSYIINNVGESALQILASGLHGGLTSPSRPWFRLTLSDLEMAEWLPARGWLDDVRDRLLRIFQKSNFYQSIHGVYEEIGAFGTNSMFISESDETVIRCRMMTTGEAYFSLNSELKADTCYRLLSMSARQMVEVFGEDVLPSQVRSVLERKPETRYLVVHYVGPKEDGEGFDSIYFLHDSEPKVLKRGTFNSLPFVMARWRVTGSDIYGRSPGMTSLPDIKQLQRIEKDKLKGLAKVVDPPMVATGQLDPAGGNIIPGGVTYILDPASPDAYRPAYQVSLDLRSITEETLRIENRIRHTFYNDLFLSILQEEKTMTAREVVERHNEKLLLLGPVLERLQSELLDGVIERTLEIAFRQDLIPPPPDDLAGQELRIEYVSLLAQAQKLTGLNALEQLTNYTGAVAQMAPEALDRVDPDKLIEVYAETLGVEADVLRDDEEVQDLREERQKQAQAAQALQAAEQAAKATKDLAQAPMGGDSALDRLAPQLTQTVNEAQDAQGQTGIEG